jgi:hypothetical protein
MHDTMQSSSRQRRIFRKAGEFCSAQEYLEIDLLEIGIPIPLLH